MFYVEFSLSGSLFFFFLMIRRPPRSTLDRSSAASDVYKRQVLDLGMVELLDPITDNQREELRAHLLLSGLVLMLSLIHISEPTRPY